MKKCLIVVDMQNDFISGALGSEDAQEIVPHVVRKVKEYLQRGEDIMFTLDTHGEDYLQTQEGINLPVKHCIKGTPGHEICEEIKAVCDPAQYPCYEKGTFGSRELALDLSARDYDFIELVGLCTDICVISNAMLLKAFIPEATIVVDAYCCAGISPESHENALDAMEMCQMKIENRDL